MWRKREKNATPRMSEKVHLFPFVRGKWTWKENKESIQLMNLQFRRPSQSKIEVQ
jgi:hypothetical protein